MPTLTNSVYSSLEKHLFEFGVSVAFLIYQALILSSATRDMGAVLPFGFLTFIFTASLGNAGYNLFLAAVMGMIVGLKELKGLKT